MVILIIGLHSFRRVLLRRDMVAPQVSVGRHHLSPRGLRAPTEAVALDCNAGYLPSLRYSPVNLKIQAQHCPRTVCGKPVQRPYNRVHLGE